MKRFASLLLLLCISLCGMAQTDSNAYKFILDYQVPASPAFTILDVTPQQVTRGGAAKPLVVNLFTDVIQTGKLNPGVALDFSPYILLGGGFKNLAEYQSSWFKRTLANTLFSVASLKNSLDSGSTDIGLGIRITLFDDRDLFSHRNATITNEIGSALAQAATAPVVLGGIPEDVIGTTPVPVDLASIYTHAYEAVRAKKGFASALGFGYRTTAKGAVLANDSLINQQYKGWWSVAAYNIFKGADLLSLVQARMGPGMRPEWKGGLALTSQNRYSNVAAEVVYNTLTTEWEYGASAEFRLLKQLSYVLSLGKRSIEGKEPVEKFRVLSTFRFHLLTH